MTKGNAQYAPKPDDASVRRFYDALPLGSTKAKHGRDLAKELELDPVNWDRLLRALAETAIIEHGLLVCTGNPGYWRPVSREDAAQSTAWKAAQAARMWERVRAEQMLLEQAFPVAAAPAAVTVFENIAGEAAPLFPDVLPSDAYEQSQRK